MVLVSHTSSKPRAPIILQRPVFFLFILENYLGKLPSSPTHDLCDACRPHGVSGVSECTQGFKIQNRIWFLSLRDIEIYLTLLLVRKMDKWLVNCLNLCLPLSFWKLYNVALI